MNYSDVLTQQFTPFEALLILLVVAGIAVVVAYRTTRYIPPPVPKDDEPKHGWPQEPR